MRKDYQFDLDAFDEATGGMNLMELGMLMKLIHLQNRGLVLPSTHSEVAMLLGAGHVQTMNFVIRLYNEGIAEDIGPKTMLIKTEQVGITLV